MADVIEDAKTLEQYLLKMGRRVVVVIDAKRLGVVRLSDEEMLSLGWVRAAKP